MSFILPSPSAHHHSLPLPKKSRKSRLATFIFRFPFLTILLCFLSSFFLLNLISSLGPLKITMSPSTWYDKSSLVTLNQLAFKQSIGRWTSRVLSTGSQVEIQSQILDEFTIVWAVDEDVGEEGLMEGERLKMMFE